MAHDPYKCDAVLSVALLVAFSALVPSILTVSPLEWVVASASYWVDGTTVVLQNEEASADEPPSEPYEVTTDYAQDDTFTTYIADHMAVIPEDRMIPGPTGFPDADQEVTTYVEVLEEGESKTMTAKDTLLIANLYDLCMISTSEHSCQRLHLYTSQCQKEPKSRKRREIRPAPEANNVECDAMLLSNRMSGFATSFQVIRISAVCAAIACTIIMAMLTLFNEDDRKFKLIVGSIFAVAGGIEIAVVVLVQNMVIKEFSQASSATTYMGSGCYFSLMSGSMHLVTTLVLCIPTRKASPEPPESKLEVPFRDYNDESQKHVKFSCPPADGFLADDGDESGEWGYSPVVLDGKDVKFELTSLDEEAVEKPPELTMCNKDVKVFDLGENVHKRPSTSSLKAIISQKIECNEEAHKLATLSGNNSSCVSKVPVAVDHLYDALKEDRIENKVGLHSEERKVVENDAIFSPFEEKALPPAQQEVALSEQQRDAELGLCDSSERAPRAGSSDISYEMISDLGIVSSNHSGGFVINDDIELTAKESKEFFLENENLTTPNTENIERNRLEYEENIENPSFSNIEGLLQGAELPESSPTSDKVESENINSNGTGNDITEPDGQYENDA